MDKAVRPHRGVRLCGCENRRAVTNRGEGCGAFFEASDAQAQIWVVWPETLMTFSPSSFLCLSQESSQPKSLG
ncbi:hypothetical protein AGR4A_Cc50127 [Agrobacterium tumefaciens str. B6]|uniref:Uncharacterized protein n=1 Tax=Agrobacterium tumefaciens str. B6 TaxID=1183423 RepID=A0A822V374_AGRTU|nr:hypothetical protein AGR4A_Cc50127 [Agrobacterium tumefaciens str. B6]